MLVEIVIGDMRESELASRLHRLEHTDAVDTINLAAGDLARHRLRVTSSKGVEIAIALPRDQSLFDGAVLILEQDRAVVVRALPTKWLAVVPRDAAAALELGYHAGNLHWRVRFEGFRLMIALDGPAASYTARLSRLVEDGMIEIAP